MAGTGVEDSDEVQEGKKRKDVTVESDGERERGKNGGR